MKYIDTKAHIAHTETCVTLAFVIPSTINLEISVKRGITIP